MGASLVKTGRPGEAVAALEKAVALSHRAPAYLTYLGVSHAEAGRVAEARGVLAELDAASRAGYVPPAAFTFIHAALGETDRAFEYLARAREDGASPFDFFNPIIEKLRTDPRHRAHLRERGVAVG